MVTDQSYIDKAYEYMRKAYNLQMNGKLEEAVKNYQISLDIYPTAEAHTYLGWTYSFMGKLDKAIDECKKAIDLDPDYGNPYNDIGSYLIEKGEIEEAITWIELAIKSKNYNAKHYAHLNLGRAFEIKGMWFEALEEFKTALKLKPGFESAQKLYYSLQGKLN